MDYAFPRQQHKFKAHSLGKNVTILESDDFTEWSTEEIRGYQVQLIEDERKRLTNRREFPHKKTDYRTVVDKKYDLALASVKDYGVVSFVRKAGMPEIVQKAVTLLRKVSPVKYGTYMLNHIIMVNGKELPLHAIDQIVLSPDDIIQLVNVSEYARKMEGYDIAGGGRTKKGTPRKRKPQSSQAPQGVYRLVARLLKQQYGNTAFIKYTFRTMESARTVRVTRGKSAGTSKQNRYPMIRIAFSSGTKL
jgi:hypothetical protein